MDCRQVWVSRSNERETSLVAATNLLLRLSKKHVPLTDAAKESKISALEAETFILTFNIKAFVPYKFLGM